MRIKQNNQITAAIGEYISLFCIIFYKTQLSFAIQKVRRSIKLGQIKTEVHNTGVGMNKE